MSIGNLINDALKHHREKEFDKAEQLYLQTLKEYPDSVDALNLLGLLKLQNKQSKEAVYYIERAAELKPCAYLLANLGRAHFMNLNYEASISSYKKALELEPGNFEALFNLAISYKAIGQYEEAIQTYQFALNFCKDSFEIYFNLGNIHELLNQTAKALEYYQKALEIKPKDNATNYFLGISNLKLKNFEFGWNFYETRPSKKFSILTQAKEYPDIHNKPIWKGESLEGKTLFVYYEAGLGDTIMFSRYINLIKYKDAKIIFKPQYNLASLFKESNLNAQIIELKTKKDNVKFDFHIPIMSLPFALKQSNQEIPYTNSYLLANNSKIQETKKQFFSTNKFKIGIKWQGNPSYETNRIIPLKEFSNLFNLPNVQFYSLQKGSGIEELDEIKNNIAITDLNPAMNDFSDTAALISNLDLLICNDTSIAHLAGALGKQCWVLLPFVQNWRWTTDINKCIWYDSVKLFKQSEPNNWKKVFDEIQQTLLTTII